MTICIYITGGIKVPRGKHYTLLEGLNAPKAEKPAIIPADKPAMIPADK